MKYILPLAAFALSLSLSAAALAKDPVKVGGKDMLPARDIIDNAVNSADHTTLVAAVKAADLVSTLKGKGPFTVFAPTNAAFAKLPAGTVESLLKPDAKGTLTSVLTYHVVPGAHDFNALAKMIKDGKGSAKLKTVQGGTLTAWMNGPHNIMLSDAKGGTANISTYDVHQSNGVIHVIDTVVMP